MASVCMAAGIICALYFVCMALLAGNGTNFHYIWLLGGIVLFLWGYGMRRGITAQLPNWLKWTAGCLAAAAVLLFLIVEGMIVSGFRQKGEKNLDYIIVLGAQLKESGPSRVLQYRLDRAYWYLTENENTVAIVSGGQGANEPDSEAQGMYDYLTGRGIAPDRIRKEDRSKYTVQNIQYSSSFLDKGKDTVGVVTNNFHIFRATQLAKAAGYKNVYGISSPSHLFYQPNNMLREFFGVVKDFLVGNLS